MPLDLEKIDLGSFGLNEDEQQVQLNSNVTEAVKINPDQHAQITTLAKESGVPEFAVQSNPEQIKQKLKLDKIDLDGMINRSPATSKFLSGDANNSIIAQEDVITGLLESIEKTFDGLGESIVIGFEKQVTGSMLRSNEKSSNRRDEIIPWGTFPIFINQSEAQQISLDIAENFNVKTDEEYVALKSEASDNLIKHVQALEAKQKKLTPKDLTIIQEGVRSGIESLANMIPAVFAGIATKGRTLPMSIIGVQSYTRAYGESRAKGLSVDDADNFATIDATIEVATELLPTGTLQKMLTGKGGDLKKDAIKFLIQEMGTEQIATALQTVNSFAFDLDEQLKNAKTLDEVIEIQARRQAVTAIATIVAGGSQITVVSAANKAINKLTENEQKKETQGDVEQQSIDKLNADSEKSKLRERDVESFKQFINEADGENNSHVFIDGVQTSLYLQGKTREEIDNDPALKVLDNALQESQESGTDVSVDVADFAGDVAGTEHFTELREHMTMGEESISPFRQDQHKQETREYVNTLMSEAQENVSEYVEAQDIYTTVRDQLIDSGAVNAANASVMAQIVPAWATAQARSRGTTVAEVYQSAGLTIEGPQTGERTRLEGEQVLSQEPAQTVDQIESTLIEEFEDLKLSISGRNDNVTLNKIIIPEGQRSQGVGSQVMQRIMDWADQNGKTVALTPSKDFGGSVSRLKSFYKQLGFVDNKGSNKDFEISESMLREPVATVPQRGTIPITEETDEQITRRSEEANQRQVRQETIDKAKSRNDEEALVEFNRAKAGEQVTFTHRSFDDFANFDDTLLGTNTTTPSGNLGHYLSSDDIQNADRYGNEVSVHQFTFTNPLVISAETFEEVMGDLTTEEVTERREALMELGHDGVLVEGLNWAIAFEGSTLTKLQDDAGLLLAQKPVEAAEFKKWSGGGEVVEAENINDHKFKANTPVVVKVFHGTTFDFDVFDALRGNLEGQFGAINYFTSSEQDAADNYTGEGPDLTNRIEQQAERIVDDIQDVIDEKGVDAAKTQFDITEDEFSEDTTEIARNLARRTLAGGQDQTMELFVRVDNPFVIGENAEWVEFVDNDEIHSLAIDRVSEDQDITVEEVNENIDDYQDQIDEARWDIEQEQEHPLADAIQTVANRHDVDASSLASEVYDLGENATPETIEQLIRGNEEISYAEDAETGELINSQLITEIIEEMGFDSIILRDANSRFETMEMEPGTAHVHVFDSNKTNIKSVDNQGTFDPTDPNIFRQKPDTTEARGYYDPANSVIRLTESADLSTFLHEFAHFMYEMEATGNTDLNQSINSWYKRNSEEVAKEAGTYAPNTTIIQKHVNSFLDEGTAGDKERDVAIRRAVHEQFARGFESYLMEGKAPSIELRNAFRTFARWLSQIYQALRGKLRVNLDNEMREVFDKLLATEEQIAAAESRARVEPMFTDAAMAGMTEKEFADYQQRQSKVKDVQSETLRDQLVKQITRQTKQQWKDEKADIVDEELDKLANEPVYVASTRLKDGDIKLDHATVKEMMGEERTNKLGRTSTHVPSALRGMTATGQKGVHPDEAAAFFGYNSGSEMLNELVTSPKIKDVAETNAERRMIERHGDILTDGTIEQLADEAVQNEERGRLILHELKMVSRNTNQKVLDRQTVKSLAEERISQLSFRAIHPGKYRKAEISAAQESAKMLAEGNREGSAQAKARQALNYYLGMAATNAKNETTKIVDRMSRYNKKKVREEIQKAEGGYWNQITKILERFDFRKSATLTAVDQVNQDINTWAKERMELDGDGLVLHTAVLNESYITHWKNVAFSDLQGINDSVKNIEHVARYANKLTRMGEEIEFNKLVSNLVNVAEETGTGRFKRKASTADAVSWAEQKGRWAMAQMTKIPFMMSWMDGGKRVGTWFNTFSQPMTDAYNDELKLYGEIGVPVAKMITGRTKEQIKRHNTTFFIPEIKDTADGTHSGNLKGHEIVAIALNTGNKSNLRKLLLGEQWANPDNDVEIDLQNSKLQAVLSHMTKSDWEMVQSIWDHIELLYPKLSEVHRRTTGLVPPKVESTPVETEHGTFKGGYYPVKYDPNRDNKAAENEERRDAEVSSMFSNNASIQASVNAGATNERTGYYAPIQLSLNVVTNHIQETIHYITHHDAVREANRLIRDPRVKKAVSDKLGPEEYAQLKPWLNDIAKDGRNAPNKSIVDAIFNKLRLGTTLGVMGFKASTGIIQISGLSNSIAEVGLKPMMQAMRTVLGSVSTMKSAWEFATTNSKVLSHRVKTMDREIKNAMQQLENKRGPLAAIQEMSMKHIALIQTYMVDLPSWHASYIKEMSESGDETKAFQYADWVIENVQGSGVTKDMASLMRNQSKTHTIFTMFMTFFSSLWNMQRDLVKGARSGLYSRTSVAAKIGFLFTLPVIFEMMMRGEFSKEDDDDDESITQTILTKVAMYPIQSVPFLRDVANGVIGKYNYNASPVTSVIEQGLQSTKGLSSALVTDDEITKGQAKGATKLAGVALGVPGTSQAWATGEHLYDVIVEGEELTMHQLLFGPKRKK